MPLVLDSSELWFAATNCWVLAMDTGGPAIVVDAPPDPEGIGRLLAAHDLYPAALVLTHGHVDHIGSAGEVVAGNQGISAYIHPADDYLRPPSGRPTPQPFRSGPSTERGRGVRGT